MTLLNESDANLSRSGQVFLTHVSSDSDPSSDCTVRDWVRRGDASPVEDVPLASIRNSFTPRKTKVNEHHAGVLAQSPLPLPPIVIHRASMRVIDGVHRLRATELRGQNTIAAKFFDGDDAEAFALAVHLNVTHGLPLTLSERKAAAQKIVESHPHWSDRSIGLIAGVSNKTVGKLRGCATEEVPQLSPRLGRDGKTRPVSPVVGRRRAAEFLSMNPARIAARDRTGSRASRSPPHAMCAGASTKVKVRCPTLSPNRRVSARANRRRSARRLPRDNSGRGESLSGGSGTRPSPATAKRSIGPLVGAGPHAVAAAVHRRGRN